MFQIALREIPSGRVMRKKPHTKHPPSEAAPVPDTLAAAGPDTARPEVLPEAAGADVPAPPAAAGPPETGVVPPGDSGLAPREPVGQEVARLERELADQKDRLLRTAADFDNYRKRAAKEKAETWGRAQADLLQRVLEVIDDVGRVAHLDPAQTSAQALHEGMGLVERKLLKVLEGVGLERVDPSGQVFDPNSHEAVMTVPAPTAEQDGGVSMVFQAGYRINGMLLRPARVAVYAWVEPPPGETVL
jgi:molecular chaperone GrpE